MSDVCHKALLRAVRLLALATAFTVLPATAAAAADPIEGIWTFGGGKVGVAAEPDGTFTGIVSAPTKFARCTHQVGERMWTDVTRQDDGSYHGLHQWFFEDAACTPNPVLGLTAWRVLSAGGSNFLRVCFSEPGSSSQPTIAADGTVANATYGCADSAHVGALPEELGEPPAQVTLPEAASCRSRKTLRIRIRYPRDEPPAKIVVKLHSGEIDRKAKIVRHPGHAVAVLQLRGLSQPKFKVTIKLVTIFGRKLERKRTYRLCGEKGSAKRNRLAFSA